RVRAARQRRQSVDRSHPHHLSRPDQRLRREAGGAMTRSRATIVVLLVVGVIGVGVGAAGAHQLDEYLQATRIAAARDHLVGELSLTPGAAVAPQIFQAIDRDGDGRISADDIDRYARRVLSDLVLSVDGTAVPLTLAHVDCPSWDEMREGAGTI